CQQGNTIWTF
nr:immunoglobulin light chain junction region [Macaca mulatta]MOV65694.1 immunoglobulin light chain junction region [Macaca mulatta]